MAEKRKTRAELDAENYKLTSELAAAHEELKSVGQALKDQRNAEAANIKRLHSQIDDLKARLVHAEAANHRMQGYLDRVREDDVVREDLVATGDPHGEQTMVPKRPAPMRYVASYDETYGLTGAMGTTGYDSGHRNTRPRHWVTYGAP